MPTDVKTPKKVFDKENSGSNKDIASPSKKKATASVSPIGSPQKDAEAAVPASPRTSTQAHQSTPNTPARPASKSDATPKRSESPVPGTPPPRPPSSSSSNIEYKTQNLGPGSANVKVRVTLLRRLLHGVADLATSQSGAMCVRGRPVWCAGSLRSCALVPTSLECLSHHVASRLAFAMAPTFSVSIALLMHRTQGAPRCKPRPLHSFDRSYLLLLFVTPYRCSRFVSPGVNSREASHSPGDRAERQHQLADLRH